MLREFSADLHIHTCLSPCASLDLSPRKIVERARDAGLEIIAITDHNTAQNVEPVMRAGEKMGLWVIAGMEVQTREEIHLLTLFPGCPEMAQWEEEVRKVLPDVPNDPKYLGDQPVVDEEGYILRFEERMLLNSLDLSLEDVFRRVEELGGIVIPSHFDKGSFSLISQLGFIPKGLELLALEICRGKRLKENLPPMPPEIPRIVSSDAHFLEDIGQARTIFLLAEASLDEILLAFRNQEGRRIVRRLEGADALP
jgi:3',5'-nucleoside bisphosphate phosphatase